MTALSASLYAADPLRLEAQITALEPVVESFHIDIMDGGFAPDFGLNGALLQRLTAHTRRPLDVHLMLREPAQIALRYAAMGVRSVAFHLESACDPLALAGQIRARGAKAFAALRHDTPLDRLGAVLHAVDGLLLLTAPAGGGVFQPDALDRVRARPRGLPVIVDGKIAAGHFEALQQAEVDIAVMGAALFENGGAGLRPHARGLAEALAGGVAVPRGGAAMGEQRA